MIAMASQIASLTFVYSTVYSCSDQRTHQSSASLSFVRGINRWPVNSPHKWPVTRKMFPFDDVIMMTLRNLPDVSAAWHRSHAFVVCSFVESLNLSNVISKRIPDGTVYPKKYAHGFCFAVLCCGYTLTDFPISIRLISLTLWQSNDCPSASKANLMNIDKYFMWIHYERLHNHNKAQHNKTVCIFLGIYRNYRGYY